MSSTGFKFAPVIGKIITKMIQGESLNEFDLNAFKIN